MMDLDVHAGIIRVDSRRVTIVSQADRWNEREAVRQRRQESQTDTDNIRQNIRQIPSQ